MLRAYLTHSMDDDDDDVIYGKAVEETLKEVFPSDDPLDRPTFDTVAYINQHFPDEASLATIDGFLGTCEERIAGVDKEIVQAVRQQSTAGRQAERDITDAKGAIGELFIKIKDIKSKAEQSEVMVKEICRDIKQLDYAKRHLTSTITALKRLHMLVTAVEQLQFMAQKRQYREAANLLKAVHQLSTHFAAYHKVPKIKDLRLNVERTKEELTHQILDDFAIPGITV